MTLQLMIATIFPEGIRRVAVMELPEVVGVSYIVAWQMPGDEPVPEVLAQRKDIEIIKSDSRGVARNRNIALRAATADILMLSDDDLRYTPESLLEVIGIFESHPEIDFALFRYDGGDKLYPSAETPFTLPTRVKGWYISEVELAFRREIVQGKVDFDEEFGIGAGYIGAGEVDILLVRLLRYLGLSGKFFPVTIARHPHHFSTGERLNQPISVIRSRGLFRQIFYPLSWPLRVPLDALRDHRSGRSSFFRSAIAMIQGAIYSIRHLNPDGTRKIR